MIVFLLRHFSRGLAALPRATALRWGRGAGVILGSALRFRRRTVMEGLARSFPEMTRREVNQVAAAMYRHLGMNIVEAARVSVRGLHDLEGHVYTHGLENFPREATEGRRGVLVLMGHIGNWELCGWLTRVLPSPVTVVVKPMGSKGMDRYVSATRARMNLRILHFRASYRESLKALARCEVVAVVLDQNTRRSVGVFVDFFGRPACTSPGLAILAAQTQSPVMPIYSLRRADGDHDVYLLPPLPPPPDRKRETQREATQQYTRLLEDIIRQHPEQWLWIHRRWKTLPDPDTEEVAKA